ncbi:MAG: methyltransferase domain-containing protein [Caulobacteraceae bacterium]|nr:methyltransferase domain-containing protein [Caulobacteraceae bacterium]
MRRDVLELREFYASPLGLAARSIIARRVTEAWGSAGALDVLGLGYATPYLGAFQPAARRTVAAMPAAQGVEVWPASGGALTCLGDEQRLPFPNALFDRVLVIHALEEADDPLAMLREVWRVLSPSGRVILAAANRRGIWSNSESTPFGHGQPFTRIQLEDLAREAELEPVAWSRALFGPPVQWSVQWAYSLERIGARLWPGLSGLILLEAVKQTYAVRPKGRRMPVRVFAPGGLQPAGMAPPPAAHTGSAPGRWGASRPISRRSAQKA